jgi:hypothetical protein
MAPRPSYDALPRGEEQQEEPPPRESVPHEPEDDGDTDRPADCPAPDPEARPTMLQTATQSRQNSLPSVSCITRHDSS